MNFTGVIRGHSRILAKEGMEGGERRAFQSKKRLLCRQLGNESSAIAIPDGQGGDQPKAMREPTRPHWGSTRDLLSKEGTTQGYHEE